jgi:small-conductance mechanosensitive channel
MVNSSLENIGENPYIRWLTNIGITYDMPPGKVEKAMQLIREILEHHEGMMIISIRSGRCFIGIGIFLSNETSFAGY